VHHLDESNFVRLVLTRVGHWETIEKVPHAISFSVGLSIHKVRHTFSQHVPRWMSWTKVVDELK
jgi:hypothetical protein